MLLESFKFVLDVAALQRLWIGEIIIMVLTLGKSGPVCTLKGSIAVEDTFCWKVFREV